MLNEGDIDFMRDAQMEIYELRQREIAVIYDEVHYDPITGAEIGRGEVSREINAVVTELTSSIPERTLEGGIEYDEGDIKVDVKLAYIYDIARKISHMNFDGKEYEILSIDKKGIGRRNRYEIIGRETV